MRLGAQEVQLGAGTRARELYGRDLILERHRHRYEFNNNYLERFTRRGPALLRLLARRAGRDHRAAEPSVVRGHAVPPGVHLHAARRASAVHRLHPRRARPARLAAAAGRGRMTSCAVKLTGFEVGVDRPLFLIAGPCVIESRGPGRRRLPAPAGDHQRAWGSRSSSRPPSTRRTAPRAASFRGPGIEAGLKVLRRRAQEPQACRC